MVPQGMTKPAIARGLQPQLHHVEASELSVRPTLTLSGGSKGLLCARLANSKGSASDLFLKTGLI